MLIHAENIKRTKHRMTQLYAEHCKRSYEEFERAMDRDRFMTPEEAVEWGLVDRVLPVRQDERDTTGHEQD
jgi:ATP-dependent Clp protease protease subunit